MLNVTTPPPHCNRLEMPTTTCVRWRMALSGLRGVAERQTFIQVLVAPAAFPHRSRVQGSSLLPARWMTLSVVPLVMPPHTPVSE